MRRFRIAAALVVFAASALPAWTVSGPQPTDCQYVHVVDPCQMDLLIFDAGDTYITHNIPLDTGFAGQFQPGGVDFATVPNYAQKYSFITQGPFLRVIHHQLALPWRSVDIEMSFDLDGILLSRLQAAEPVEVNGETRYLLYVIGHRSNPAGQPWLIVLDQEALLADTLDINSVLLASGPVCVDGVDCLGAGIDIAVGAPLDGGGLHEAYASVLNVAGTEHYQRFYKITMNSNFSFDVTLEPWNDEGIPWSASAHRAIGLDYDGFGLQPFGAFQTSSVISDLSNGDDSCPVTGDPTDVEVWGPGSGLENTNYHFVTSIVPGGDDLLLGFPAGECPDGSADTLSLPIGDFPRALGISSDSENTFWIYTANKQHGLNAVRLQLSSESGVGDRIEVLANHDIPFEGCPIAVSFRDESFQQCEFFDDQPQPASPGPPDGDDCPPGSTDPDCVEPETFQPTCNPGEDCSLPLGPPR